MSCIQKVPLFSPHIRNVCKVREADCETVTVDFIEHADSEPWYHCVVRMLVNNNNVGVNMKQGWALCISCYCLDC